ncbi:hypothetical protein ACFQY8_00410 [Alloscardovia venturai]|uniref:Glycosyl transferase n=2 Tax=Alloscardovia venturai TaxID=1769421 RepID=A0ABW2Y1U2_9BIFI
MDVDLSTSLDHIDNLVHPILTGVSDIAIGSRLMKSSATTRSFKREFISRTYNALLHMYSGAQFSDAQCGFKAIRANTFHALVPQLYDNEWFFDTEMLLLAQYRGYRLTQVPVHWVEDQSSSVHITDTILKDLKGMHRMRRTRKKYTCDRTYLPHLKQQVDALETQRDSSLRGSLVPIALLA